MLCEAPFYPNQFNYVNDDEHDKNSHKHWYLVLGVGLFTAKADADLRDPTPRKDGVLLFFIRSRVEAKWSKQCRKRHTHLNEEVVPESSDSDDSDDGDDSPPITVLPGSRSAATSIPVRASTRVKKEVKQEVQKQEEIPLPLYLDDPTSIVTPVDRTPSLKRTAVRVQPGSQKRAKSRGVVQAPSTSSRAATTPIPKAKRISHRSGSPGPLSAALSESATTTIATSTAVITNDAVMANAAAAPSAGAEIPHASVRSRPHYRDLRINPPLSAAPGSPILLRPATTPARVSCTPTVASIASSPSVSSASSMSASSISTTAGAEADAGLPFLDLRASVSTGGGDAPPFGGAEFGRFVSSVHRAGPSTSKSAGSKRASTAMSTAGVIRGAMGKGKEKSASPTQLLYNNDTRTLYKDPAKAVREMAEMESIQVVELEQVVGYLSSGPAQGKRMP